MTEHPNAAVVRSLYERLEASAGKELGVVHKRKDGHEQLRNDATYL